VMHSGDEDDRLRCRPRQDHDWLPVPVARHTRSTGRNGQSWLSGE